MGLKDWLTKHLYVTTPDDPDRFFRPRRFSQSREEVVKAVREVIDSLKDWRIEEYRENQGRFRASSGTLFPPASEDINIYIVRGLDGITKLEMTSQSRGGKLAWGRNKRNLRDLLSRLDQKMSSLS